MSNTKYLGEIELINAAASIRKKLEQAPSFDQALPCSADASYTDEMSVKVPAVVQVKPVKNKREPDVAYYKLRLDAKLPEYGVESTLAIGTREEIMAWLDQCTDHEALFKRLFDIYRGAWETFDSVRHRDW